MSTGRTCADLEVSQQTSGCAAFKATFRVLVSLFASIVRVADDTPGAVGYSAERRRVSAQIAGGKRLLLSPAMPAIQPSVGLSGRLRFAIILAASTVSRTLRMADTHSDFVVLGCGAAGVAIAHQLCIRSNLASRVTVLYQGDDEGSSFSNQKWKHSGLWYWYPWEENAVACWHAYSSMHSLEKQYLLTAQSYFLASKQRRLENDGCGGKTGRFHFKKLIRIFLSSGGH